MCAMVDSGWRLRPLPADEASRVRATDVLAQAFRDDAVARYVEADPAKRGLLARGFFDTLLAAIPLDAVRVTMVRLSVDGVGAGAHRSSMAELTAWTLWADKVVTF